MGEVTKKVRAADALAVDCPGCGAKAGDPCERFGPIRLYHNPRWWAAEDVAEAAGIDDVELPEWDEGEQ